jgi:1-phosphatidylinositol phosphodiesterase
MSIQQENAATPLFLSLLKQHISDSGREHWFLENRIPSLGQVRGKIVLFSRFGGTDRREWEDIGGMGLHVDGWRDSVRGGFEVSLPEGKEKEGFGWKMAIQDWYV